ncbi:hypothetical protein DPX16_9149 [Anabarilius grahami]|uniref:Uncharacterized protein n=1 Tax=Anabarilius grahami TaxID=495550 RepID=A0A3N0YA00_ANAGA|nr:hypothetical protein DPX16_9149 [Anabarilius grahami]
MSAIAESRPIMAATPVSSDKLATMPEPLLIMAATPEPPAIMDATSVFLVVMSAAHKNIKAFPRLLRLASSLEDTPLMSVRAAGISAAMSSLGVPEEDPLSIVLPVTWAVRCCGGLQHH